MVKNEKEVIQNNKKTNLKKIVFKTIIVFMLAGFIYAGWKNPQIWPQIKYWFEPKQNVDIYQTQINDLNTQINTLKQQVIALSTQIKEPDLSEVNAKISAIEKMNLNVIDSKADIATVLGVITRMDKAEQKLDNILDINDDSALILTGVMLVKDAAQRGGKFVYEAEVLNLLVEDKPKLKKSALKLENFANTGIASEKELIDEFITIYNQISKEQKESVIKNWKERLNNKFNEMVQIKKINVSEEDIKEETEITQIIQQVNTGYIKQAVKSLQSSTFATDERMKKWLEKATTKIEFEEMISELTSYSLAALKVKFLKN